MSEKPESVNLDQLLDLKRAEKPSRDFWEEFQKDFRQRQLLTLMEKESIWSRLPRFLSARSHVLVPVSSLAIALFVLIVNFQDNTPIQNEYFETAPVAPVIAQPEVSEVLEELIVPAVPEEVAESVPALSRPSPASFVIDVIPNEQPDSLLYTREFPTSTIRSESRALSALVSYTIARETPTVGMSMAHAPQTIGF